VWWDLSEVLRHCRVLVEERGRALEREGTNVRVGKRCVALHWWWWRWWLAFRSSKMCSGVRGGWWAEGGRRKAEGWGLSGGPGWWGVGTH